MFFLLLHLAPLEAVVPLAVDSSLCPLSGADCESGRLDLLCEDDQAWGKDDEEKVCSDRDCRVVPICTLA